MKLKYFLFLFLSFLIFNSSLLIGTVRYVSKTGTNQPPYTSWQTAADSIQKCINICSFGDTVYVANGNYKEQIVMIPGLSLIGAGMDSCIIDTREIVGPNNFWAVTLANNSTFTGFNIKVSIDTENGGGIRAVNNSEDSLFFSDVSYNKIETAFFGILIDNFTSVSFENKTYFHHNLLSNIDWGILTGNASSHILENYLTNILSRGIDINSIVFSYKPLIEKNIIFTPGTGINEAIGAKPTIRNNMIFLNDDFAEGIWGGSPDTLWVYNNLVVAEYARNGIINAIVSTCVNNFVLGNFWYHSLNSSNQNIIKNNVIINGITGITKPSNDNPTIKYNNSWNNDVNYSGFTPDSTNLSVDPMIVNDDTTRGELDFHLQKYSPLIDAGDPNILDRDGSRSDIGLYGGPYGWTYTYNDLAPRPPHNITAVNENGLIKLTWNNNTEADFSYYRIYRDTVSILIYDSTKIVGTTSDTVFYDNLPTSNSEKKYYYLITAFDNQGNQSAPSEEINVTITGLSEHPPIGFDNYALLSNYPNPFNPSTIIPYRLKEGGYVKLYIYDMKGELVRVLVNEYQNAGYYEARFSPTEAERNNPNMDMDWHTGYNDDVASGVYLYQIMVRGEGDIPVFTDMGKMILLK